MTEADVIHVLTGWHWDLMKHTLIPNVHLRLGEADLVCVQKSGWMEECEVKVCKADFRRELVEKAEKHERLVRGIPNRVFSGDWKTGYVDDWSETKPTLIRRFWFAMPDALAEELLPDIPPHAGLIAVGKTTLGTPRCIVLKAAPVLRAARKMTDADMVPLLRSTYYRFWPLWRKHRGKDEQ